MLYFSGMKLNQLTAALTLCVCALATTASVASAQGDHKGTIKTNFFGWFAGQYQFGYEHVLNEHMTVQLMAGILDGGTSQSMLDSLTLVAYAFEQNKSGVIIIPEFRYYPSPSSTYMEGLYFAGFGRLRASTWDLDDTGAIGVGDVSREEKRTVFSAGALLGYSYYLGNGFNAEIFAGPQFKAVSSSREYANYTTESEGNAAFASKFADFSIAGLENEGIGLRFGLNIGFGL